MKIFEHHHRLSLDCQGKQIVVSCQLATFQHHSSSTSKTQHSRMHVGMSFLSLLYSYCTFARTVLEPEAFVTCTKVSLVSIAIPFAATTKNCSVVPRPLPPTIVEPTVVPTPVTHFQQPNGGFPRTPLALSQHHLLQLGHHFHSRIWRPCRPGFSSSLNGRQKTPKIATVGCIIGVTLHLFCRSSVRFLMSITDPTVCMPCLRPTRATQHSWDYQSVLPGNRIQWPSCLKLFLTHQAPSSFLGGWSWCLFGTIVAAGMSTADGAILLPWILALPTTS
jgi:hypothetical protein